MASVPEKSRTATKAATDHTVIMHAQWTGPLPPPAVLKQYDEIATGLAERIVVSMEREQEHRHEMDRKLLVAYQAIYTRGQFLAAFIALTCLVLGFALGYQGQSAAAIAFVTGGLGQVVLAFLGSRERRPNDSDRSD